MSRPGACTSRAGGLRYRARSTRRPRWSRCRIADLTALRCLCPCRRVRSVPSCPRWSRPALPCAPRPRRRPREALYGHRPGPGLGRALKPLSLRSIGMSVLERPQPRPGVLKIQAYVPGKSSAPGVAKVFKLSSNETPLGRARRRSTHTRRSASIWRTTPTARRVICARRSARRSGLIRTASSAAPVPTICSTCSRAPT